ncbi:hypothetical protein WJX81_007469 [Elliptochloris bilobata]|uniref:Uncharacterized protein n=1 Tax=Elliptochloris bilobata TaxID=381761 RepID=A0AAW1S722_9CHLO
MRPRCARILTLCASVVVSQAIRSPVIIIPGFASSALEARINPQTASAALKTECPQLVGSQWVQIWNGNQTKACQALVFRLDVDPASGRYANTTGVEVRPLDFGGLRGIDSDGGDPEKGFWAPMVNQLRGAGYVVGQNIFGAPYDWRLAPEDGLGQVHWFADLRALIERAVASAGGMPATLVGHSMGTQISHYFLAIATTAPWRAQYVSGFFGLGPVLGGAVTALSLVLPGIIPGLTQLPLSPGDLWNAQQTWPAGPSLAPRAFAFQSRVVAEVSTNYTASDLERMLLDLGQTLPAALYRRVHQFSPTPFPALDVRVACVYGMGLPTPELVIHNPVAAAMAADATAAAPAPYMAPLAAPAPSMRRKLQAIGAPAPAPAQAPFSAAATAFFASKWSQAFGDGDGVVNLVSLRTCERLLPEAILRRPKVTHNGIVSDPDALQLLLRFAANCALPAPAPAPSPATQFTSV